MSRYNTRNLVPGAGLDAMRRWRAAHPQRWRELMREGVQYSWENNPRRRAHLATVRVRGTAAIKRDVPWQLVAELRRSGLSWRRVSAVVGVPHPTLVRRREELTAWLG